MAMLSVVPSAQDTAGRHVTHFRDCLIQKQIDSFVGLFIALLSQLLTGLCRNIPSSVNNSLMASMTFALSAVKCCLKFSSLSPPEVNSLCNDSCWSVSSLLPRDLRKISKAQKLTGKDFCIFSISNHHHHTT